MCDRKEGQGGSGSINLAALESHRKLLQELAPRFDRGTLQVEKITEISGRVSVALEATDTKGETRAILVAVPQPIGVIAARVTFARPARSAARSPIRLRLSIFGAIGGTQDLLGEADISVDTRPETPVSHRITAVEEVSGPGGTAFRKRIDWGAFWNCAVSDCVYTCIFSRLACVGCLVTCAITSIVDD